MWKRNSLKFKMSWLWVNTLSGTSQSDTQRQYEVDQHVDTLVMGGKHTPSTNLLQGKLVLEKRKKKMKLRHNGQNLSIQLEELLCKIRLALPLVLASALLQVWPQLNKMWVEQCEIRLHTRCGGCRGFPRWSLVKQVPPDPPTQSPAAHSQMSTDTKSTIKKFKMHWKG